MQIGNWRGTDTPIPEYIQRIASNDDSINRLYVYNSSNEWVNVYVAYTARPRTMLGHRPEVCYVAGGWVQDHKEKMTITCAKGTKIPCMVHHFHMPSPGYEERIVANFYIVNGQVTTDESVFGGPLWRTPNIAGDPARYVAQIQISSVLENSIRTAVEDMTDLILVFFPDENGEVKATKYANRTTDILR
jgi:hypothetical protein